MRGKSLSSGMTAAMVILAVTLFVTDASAGTIKVLHEFTINEGYQPNGLTFDAAGNLYGTTTYGGGSDMCITGVSSGCGTVFELIPTGDGRWEKKTLFVFNGWSTGDWPAAPVTFDSAGNLYGTFEIQAGTGGVFELSPTAKGPWRETLVCGLDYEEGNMPKAPVVFDAAGNIYSTAFNGGEGPSNGSVFEMTPTGTGACAETTLQIFYGDTGSFLYDSVIFDARGNLYGTAYQNSDIFSLGTVFELTPNPNGTWTETTLYTFNTLQDDAGGANPFDQRGLIFDSAGNLYGTTQNGGHFGMGTVFELSPTANGSWKRKVLHHFHGPDGSGPTAGVIFDAAGNLYGETFSGGPDNDGVVFELKPIGGGNWSEALLKSFNGHDGIGPWQGLIVDAAGNLYGTTQAGGTYGGGTAFEVTP
jgi:uncharacterized repeat protein (TIGR03803 family)